MKNSLVILTLIMLFAASFAYQLSIKVTVTQDTLSVGSNVSLETSGVEIAAGRTGDDGIVKFNVSNGSYFAILKSTLYPKQVTLIEVNGDTAVTLTKRQQISYATAYGQIIGPTDFSNATISAMQNNRVQKKVTSDSNGYYVLSLYGLPDGAYDIVFEAPGYDKISSHEYLPLSEFVEVNAKMSATAVPVELEPVLFAPAQVQQSSFVEISLTKGGSPLVGEIVAVDTPAGKINLPPTDSSGKAGINAAQSGLYVFTYGKLSSSTAVLPKQAPAPVPAPTPVPTVTPQLPVPAPSQQPNEQGGSVILAGATLFFILLLVGLLILIVWVKAIAPALAKKKHAHHETHPEHAHSETHKHEQHGATHKKAAPHKKK